jgi:hypothetical protein
MILDDAEGRHAESPGGGRVERRTTDALENHWRTDAELAIETQDQDDEVAGVSHSFLTD